MMRSTIQKKLIIVAIIGSGIFFFPSFSFAQSEPTVCRTCSAPSPKLEEYMDFSREMLATLSITWKELATWYGYNTFWPRQWGIYNTIMWDYSPSFLIQSVVMGTLKNIKRRQSHLKATAEVLSIYTRDIVKDWSLSVVNSAQPWPILRDYQYLLDIDNGVSNKIYDLGTAGLQWAQLTKEQRKRLLEVLKKNTWDGKLIASEKDYTLTSNTTTTDILRSLLHINARFKRAVSLSTTKVRSTSTKGIDLTISQVFLQAIIDDYTCVRIGKADKSCWWDFGKFKENIITIVESFVESWPKQSRERIKRASKKLLTRGKLVLWIDKINEKDKEKYLQKENDLINSRWDGKPLIKRTWRWILTGAISSNIPRTARDNRKSIAQWGQQINTVRQDIKNDNTPSPVLEDLTKSQKKSLDVTTSPQQVRISSGILADIIKDHQQAKVQQLNVSTFDSQEALSKITYNIRVINDLLSTTVKSDLTRVCNLQCSNLWWICW